jgi:hypothetical protein
LLQRESKHNFWIIEASLQSFTDEQYVLYCIEIPYQKLGLYWYWLIFKTQQYQYQTNTNKYYNSKNISGNIVYYSMNDKYKNTAHNFQISQKIQIELNN